MDQKLFLKIINCDKTNEKGGKKEVNLPKPLPSFPFFRPFLALFPKIKTSASSFLCRWLWEIKTKEDERKKRKEGVLELSKPESVNGH